MIILPAIDLRGGSAVRLLRGEYGNMTVYSSDPLGVANEFAACGAKNLHVVDLDGALSGETDNYETIKKIIGVKALAVEVGGGIRDEKKVEKYLSVGAARVILGTSAVENFAFLTDMVKKYGDKIAVGVDIKNGGVATHGWTETAGDAFDFLRKVEGVGVKTVICTDVSRDGACEGTNVALYRTLKEKFKMNVVASGGITEISELETLAKTGLYGAILGKALYSGKISLAEALKTEKI